MDDLNWKMAARLAGVELSFSDLAKLFGAFSIQDKAVLFFEVKGLPAAITVIGENRVLQPEQRGPCSVVRNNTVICCSRDELLLRFKG